MEPTSTPSPEPTAVGATTVNVSPCCTQLFLIASPEKFRAARCAALEDNRTGAGPLQRVRAGVLVEAAMVERLRRGLVANLELHALDLQAGTLLGERLG